MRVVNRITVADITRGAKINKNEAQQLYLIVGKAREVKTGTTQYGDYKEYFGVFEAIRVIDGEVFQSGRVIFPPPTDAVVDNVFTAAKAEDANAEVSFAFIIGSEEHTHAGEVKFRYTCEPQPLGDMAKTDPLADLKAALAETPAARFLPAPGKPAAQVEDKSGEGKKAKG